MDRKNDRNSREGVMDKTIEYVLEVARCGGISKAAGNLHITPSALSKYIIQKERELGISIFNRTGNRFTLTHPGERYVEMLRELRDKKQSIDAEMKRLADLYNGRLRIGFQMSLAEYMTRRIVPEMQDQYPDIKLYLKEAGGRELVKMLKEDLLDAALLLISEAPEGLCCEKILRSPVVIAAAKDSPLQKKALRREGFSCPWISDDDILAEKAVLDEGGRSFRKYAGYLVDRSPDFLREEITVSNARTALMCVAQDLGIIVLPAFLVISLNFSDEVELYSFGEEEQWTYLSVLSDPHSAVKEELQVFIQAVQESIDLST